MPPTDMEELVLETVIIGVYLSKVYHFGARNSPVGYFSTSSSRHGGGKCHGRKRRSSHTHHVAFYGEVIGGDGSINTPSSHIVLNPRRVVIDSPSLIADEFQNFAPLPSLLSPTLTPNS